MIADIAHHAAAALHVKDLVEEHTPRTVHCLKQDGFILPAGADVCGSIEHSEKFFRHDRLEQIMKSAHVVAVDGEICRACEIENDAAVPALAQRMTDIDAIAARHENIEEDDVEAFSLHHLREQRLTI